ncbi:hypothetical protein GGF50DRAFT_113184 [Schizophyllum commune]
MAGKFRQCSRGRPNATASGQSNDILDFFAVPSHRWLARAENISRGSPTTQNPSTSMFPSTASASLLDVSQGHQCIAGSPNTTATGKPMARHSNSTSATLPTLRLRKSVNADASQVHQFSRARSMTQRTSSLNDTANEQLNGPLDVYPSSRALRHRLKAFRCYARASMSVPRKSINTTLCKSINVDALKSVNADATSEHQFVRETYHLAANARRPGSSIILFLARPSRRGSSPNNRLKSESSTGNELCPWTPGGWAARGRLSPHHGE